MKTFQRFLVFISLLSLPAFAYSPYQSKQNQNPGPPGIHGTQAPAQSSAQPSASPMVLLAGDEDYRIGAGDVLQVTIQDAPELSGMVRVNSNGSFLMPYLGRVMAIGATPEELQNQIANGLRGKYLVNPQVAIVVTQYNSRTFFIQGAVRIPGVYQIEGHPSLLRLITLAGGLQDNHGSTAFIIHEVKSFGPKPAESTSGSAAAANPPASSSSTTEASGQGSVQPVAEHSSNDPAQSGSSSANSSTAGAASASSQASTNATASSDHDGSPDDDAHYEMHQVNINGLLRGNFSQNVIIEPGDIINIPPTDVFFVAGEVRSPGSFPLKDGTTLRQAISLAQGLTFRAKGSRGIIFREDPNTGKRSEIKIDVPAVMSGKQADISIKANDIIIVPNSGFKTVGGTLLSAFGVSAARVPIVY